MSELKLMRNDPSRGGLCKYALIRLDKIDLAGWQHDADEDALKRHIINQLIADRSLIELGRPHAEDEFFVIKLKDDLGAVQALIAYSQACHSHGLPEFGAQITDLAWRSGNGSPYRKFPD